VTVHLYEQTVVDEQVKDERADGSRVLDARWLSGKRAERSVYRLEGEHHGDRDR
jgi:hypothetical protein